MLPKHEPSRSTGRYESMFYCLQLTGHKPVFLCPVRLCGRLQEVTGRYDADTGTCNSTWYADDTWVLSGLSSEPRGWVLLHLSQIRGSYPSFTLPLVSMHMNPPNGSSKQE